ncbi:hypothetical protein ILUMI_21096 [Ignelater luminosus]|uniref:Uncharacterized protein n=1 Tax=Ignelater luminosus TaxID=2038154 RepID=A0A8K0CIG3_IGNLU|nr:hypothetical protein ILUMI_21096 [Ignelater luminosus]
MYEYIKHYIHEAVKEALRNLRKNTSKKPYWWDKGIENEITTKREKYEKYLSSKSSTDKIKYKKAEYMARLKKNRIEEEYANIEKEEQAGFRADRSTVDHLFAITQVIEKKLGQKMTNDGTLDEAIKDRNTQGRIAIRTMNSVLWGKNRPDDRAGKERIPPGSEYALRKPAGAIEEEALAPDERGVRESCGGDQWRKSL